LRILAVDDFIGGVCWDLAVTTSRLKRALNPMPDDVGTLLESHGVLAAYRARPAYQQNDYLGWIARARLPATRRKRIDQMLAELKSGGVYMKMKWSGGA
jgi:uncharacterized protein YdeI (YjbR/CyaY-like superfamily)